MDFEIIKNIENKLLNRKEVEILIREKNASVNRFDIMAQITKKFKTDEKLVIIEKIKPHFGKSDVIVTFSIYDDEISLKKLVSEYIRKRNTKKVVEAES